jgi:hypothetical protein
MMKFVTVLKWLSSAIPSFIDFSRVFSENRRTSFHSELGWRGLADLICDRLRGRGIG